MVELNGTLLIQILNFIILCAILGHYCYKPIIKILDERANRIKNDLQAQVVITHRWPRFSESLYTAIPALRSAA